MTSDYFFVSIKLCPEVGNDKYIVLCNFGGRSTSGFDVIEGGGGGGGSGVSPGHRRQKQRVKRTLMQNPDICYC